MVSAWDASATIRLIHGERIGLDGRSLSDGQWKIAAWSEQKGRQYWVIVKPDGGHEELERPAPDPASRDIITNVALGPIGVARAWPETWIDSVVAIANARSHQTGELHQVIGASFNEKESVVLPGQAAWSIIFDQGDGHFIGADGRYLGQH
ncbi:MAG TPA: hypothetical protein VKT78_12330 [Fimbriimonadaceae bacterium]|nr:hypothetical protein [Fimbriimonadaceae bacterium]